MRQSLRRITGNVNLLLGAIGFLGLGASCAAYWYLAAAQEQMPGLALVAGISLTSLLLLFVAALVGLNARVQREVHQRTAELQRAKQRLEQEVAEHGHTQQTLQQSQALYSSLVETLPIYVLRKDLQGRFTFANRLFCGLLGKSLEEVVGKTDFDFYPKELAEKYRSDDHRVATTGKLFTDVEQYEKDGQTLYMEVMKSPVYDPSGAIVGVQAVFWDVTQRRTAEIALEHERYLLRTLMDNVPDSIYFKDAQCRFMRVNNALARRFGLSEPSEALGKTDFDFFTEEHARQAYEDELEVMRTGKPIIGKEEKETWPDGRTTWVSSTKLPLYDNQGRLIGTFGISRDITELRKAAEALQVAKEAAEAASRAKSDFLANMSHEIRTPLNAIIGMTELVLDSNLEPAQREYLTMVRQSSESLLEVINDILDFSKIEAGKLELEHRLFELRDRLGDTMKSLGLRAHAKGLELSYHVDSNVPDGLIGDVARLRQVIVNLVGNAIKFTPAGEVALDVHCQSRSDSQVTLHFTVRDTGIGIPPDKLHVIFGAFEQADSSTTRRFGGTGLGLAISSRLVECMGGRIWAESELGRGSTFHFTAVFEVGYDQPAEIPPSLVGSLAGLPVLVVDDNATNRRILQEMLSAWKMQPTLAASAAEAIERLQAAQRSGTSFPLVLTDANMPDVDGFSLAEQIRGDKALGSTVIMMLTSGDRPGQLARCQQLGIAAYLIKPIKQSELLDAIVSALGLAIPSEVAAEAPEAPALPPLRVLLAEDSLVNQKLAVGLLERYGHTVIVAKDGREALAAWQSQPVDVILMDIQMPDMDGLEATAAIRQREAQRGGHVPIIAMTAHAIKGDRERCLAAGMDEYLSKPIRLNQLLEAISTVLGVRAAQHSPSGAEEPVNWAHAKSTVKGDLRLLRSIVQAFVEESPKLIEDIRQAIASGDAKALQIAAHTIKGSLRYFGARQAFDLAYKLEELGRAGKLGDAQEVFSLFQQRMDEVLPRLTEFLAGSS
jgi:PAS domain S-box-containing protein